MTVRHLEHMFRPKSVALIGASPRLGSIGNVIFRNLRAGGFSGPIIPVNPRHATIDGVTVYPGIAALPLVADLAIVATPAATIPDLIAQLGSHGTKAVVVVSAGFHGAAGAQLKTAMLNAARPALLRILGPNCLGVLLPSIGLNASFAHLNPAPGGIAFVSQSGAILASVIDWAGARRIGFSHLLSLGELIDVDFGDVLDYLAEDGGTTAILMYMEAVTNARKFMSAARRAARLKPVILVKAGRHAAAAAAVISHTGALAGNDDVYAAAFRRAGMLRVRDLGELFEATETLARGSRPRGDRLAILTDGGGLGILATDALLDGAGRLAELSPRTMARLDAVLPTTWSRGNPIDIIGDAPPSRYADALGALLEDDGIDATLVLNCPTAVASAVGAAEAVVGAVRGKNRCVLTSWVGDKTAGDARRILAAAGLPTYDTPEHAVRAFRHLVDYRRNQEALMETPPSLPVEFDVDAVGPRALVTQALAEKRQLLPGPSVQAVLRAYGIPMVAAEIARSPAEAGRSARRLAQPVALKIRSPDITHKSDIGGVVLNLETPAAVEQAASDMLARIAARHPELAIDGFTIEPMIVRPGAVELLIGMIEDETFGPAMVFGHGGVAVEIVRDRAIALPPLNMKLASDLMAETQVHRLLQGYRDRPAAALDKIALMLVSLSHLVADLPEVKEVDLNPVLADASGAIVLDARIVLQPAAKPGAARLSIRPYPRELEETVTLKDGRRLLLRPIRPEDEPSLRAAFSRLSQQTIRLRFFAPLRELGHEMAARLTQIDYDREMALILTDPRPTTGAAIYGVVRLAADPDNERAEYAVLVRDDIAGIGLGTLLMEKIIAYAGRRGIHSIHGDVLAENDIMLSICRRLGFDIQRQADEPRLFRVSLRLGDPSGRQP